MGIQHTKKKKRTKKSFATFLSDFFFFLKLLLTGKKCVDEWSSHTMWVADSSGDLGDQFICSASAICWDQSLRCPRCLSTLKESQAHSGTGNSAALQMNQSFRARSLLCHCNAWFLITWLWMKHPLVEFPLIISGVDYNRPVSGFARLSVEERDCNVSCFIWENKVI